MSAAYPLFWVDPTQEGFTDPTKRPRSTHLSALRLTLGTYFGFAFAGAQLPPTCSSVGVAQSAPGRPPLE